MERYKNLAVVGTSHISEESVEEVRETILAERPGIVALELDSLRFAALMSGRKKKIRLSDIREIGLKGYLFNLIGAWIEKKLGEIVKVAPGSEMRAAALAAREVNARIALIDQDIKVTLKRLSKRITFKEKARFVFELGKGLVVRRPAVRFDLRKVPSKRLIKKLLGMLKRHYPSFYKTLIEERNVYMAKRLYSLMQTSNTIIAVVGAGHEDEIIALIKRLEKDVPKKRG